MTLEEAARDYEANTRQVMIRIPGAKPTKYDPAGEIGAKYITGKAYVRETNKGTLFLDLAANYKEDIVILKEDNGTK